MDDFSSSGDEFLSNNHNVPEPPRFKETTEEDRQKLMTEADSKNTKKATKASVKLFKSK